MIKQHENYIEFDTEILSDFSEDYFAYFLKKYDVAKKTKDKVDSYYASIADIVNKAEEMPINEDREKNRRKQEVIKNLVKYIKGIIKPQMDKIKKFNIESYQIIEEEYNKINEPKTKEELQNLKNVLNNIIQEISKDENNKRITLNSFKSILNNNYFGQQSFLNVVKSTCTIEEQKMIMQKDYVSNIIETAFLQEVLEGKYTLEEIQKHIENAQNLTDEIEKIYNNLQKQIEKGKSLIDLQSYIKSKMNNCFMCEEIETITENYTEGNFIPLAVSSENMSNFFWNQNPQVPICSLCKLMLFCIPAGITVITKIEKDSNMTYREADTRCFVNYDTNVRKLLSTNRNFANNSKKEKNIANPYVECILDIVEQEKQISKWQLDSVFIVEFETEYLGYSRIRYFNIQPHVAKFLSEHADILQAITDYRFRLQITDMMLKNEDMSIAINNRLRETFNNSRVNQAFNCYLATKVRMYLDLYKKGGEKMQEESKSNNEKIDELYKIGQSIRIELKGKNETNKLERYIHKMLDSISANNKNEFMNMVIRLHLTIGRNVSPIFLEVIKDGYLDLNSIGQSFLAGLAPNEYKKSDNVEEVENQ